MNIINILKYIYLIMPISLACGLMISTNRQAKVLTGKARPKGNACVYSNFKVSLLIYFVIASVCVALIVSVFTGFSKDILKIIMRPYIQSVIVCALYYCTLALCLPLLRRYISPRNCAMLWFLPIVIVSFSGNSIRLMHSAPVLLQIRLPFPLHIDIPKTLLVIWLVVFILIVLWHIVSHLIFRHKLLSNASVITDYDIKALWFEEMRVANFETYSFLLMTSPETKTPLSIGLFRRSIHVILPEKQYSKDELRLIFSHELVHIGRRDSLLKFFLMLCTALFWFNPLMWFSKRRCAEDLEVSCDEIALLGREQEDRQKYAELLLKTAANEQGFTTCLSASSKALRYRLKHVLTRPKRFVGGILAGLIAFVLFFAAFFTDFGWSPGSASAGIFEQNELSQYQIENYYFRLPRNTREYPDADLQALYDYLDDIPVFVSSRYTVPDFERCLAFKLKSTDNDRMINIFSNCIVLQEQKNGKYKEVTFLLEKPVDWEVLKTFMRTQTGIIP